MALLVKFLIGNARNIILAMVAAFVLFNGKMFVDNWITSRENAVIQKCNEEDLANQILRLETQLAQEKLDNQRRAAELRRMAQDASRRAKQVETLQGILNDNSLTDDRISPRTKVFWHEINNQLEEMVNDDVEADLVD